MSKTEWPTDEYLAELRLEGKVAYSKIATRAVLFIAAVGALAAMSAVWTTFYNQYIAWMKAPAQTSLPLELWESFVVLLMTPVAVLGAVALVIVILQVRFLWKFELLSPQFGRLSPFRPLQLKSKLLNALKFLVFFVTSVLFVFFLYYMFSDDLLALAGLLPSERKVFEELSHKVSGIVLAVLIFPILLAGLSWLYSQWSFRNCHRMSADEKGW